MLEIQIFFLQILHQHVIFGWVRVRWDVCWPSLYLVLKRLMPTKKKISLNFYSAHTCRIRLALIGLWHDLEAAFQKKSLAGKLNLFETKSFTLITSIFLFFSSVLNCGLKLQSDGFGLDTEIGILSYLAFIQDAQLKSVLNEMVRVRINFIE